MRAHLKFLHLSILLKLKLHFWLSLSFHRHGLEFQALVPETETRELVRGRRRYQRACPWGIEAPEAERSPYQEEIKGQNPEIVDEKRKLVEDCIEQDLQKIEGKPSTFWWFICWELYVYAGYSNSIEEVFWWWS